ncbi:MAG: TetR/AcrR family transcriptional regulator [Parvibaculum sp.]|uniref:TetR/AcrR family transcriptional regulator n=1 Tax=Parvibaculum sp. TaxID=2024848 RepID=UPI0025E7873A|nr:TetR/AcrR family transcriptional regulator [Parvibaculum sp.]MCE9650920.1 TetR/AcrR family transcriptional regulator [Parvibaculum sp.]
MSNRERILELSLRLLNEEGAQAAGTTRIARVLGISPGNLYYHFKNREEIVRGLFAGLEAEFRSMMVDDVVAPISPARFAAFYLRSFDVAWKYRFFFGGLHHLLRQDEELALAYRDLQTWALDELENIVRQLARDGSMARPKGRNGFRSLGLNTWLIWMNWIRFVQISGRDQVTRDDMIEGVGQMFDLLVPYLDPAFEKAARRVLTRELRG